MRSPLMNVPPERFIFSCKPLVSQPTVGVQRKRHLGQEIGMWVNYKSQPPKIAPDSLELKTITAAFGPVAHFQDVFLGKWLQISTCEKRKK